MKKINLIESWIEETERRTWFLFETARAGTPQHGGGIKWKLQLRVSHGRWTNRNCGE
jgi:hypothetical protein